MKTLTEFPGMNLKSAVKIRNGFIADGKSPEELSQLLSQTLKLDVDKLSFLMNALEVVGSQWEDLKRVVVFGLNAGEKPSVGGIQKGDHIYLVEHYASVSPKIAKNESHHHHSKGNGRPGQRTKSKRNESKGVSAETKNPQNLGSIVRPVGAGMLPQGLPKPLIKPLATPIVATQVNSETPETK